MSLVHQGPQKKYIYCDSCKKAWLPSGEEGIGQHPNHIGQSIEFLGIEMIRDFVTEEEEVWLREEVDKTPWVDSQSGRRKQVTVSVSQTNNNFICKELLIQIINIVFGDM